MGAVVVEAGQVDAVCPAGQITDLDPVGLPPWPYWSAASTALEPAPLGQAV